jgi:DNA-binding transcriptional ArsR family regulator
MKTAYAPNLKKMPLCSIFYALSDPIRIEIVRGLLDEGELSCGQCKTPRSKSTMSHHFKVLREAGLIAKREEGTAHFLSLRAEELEERLPGIVSLLRKAKTPY